MDKREYKKRLKIQMKKHGVKLDNAEVDLFVNNFHGRLVPSVAVKKLVKPSTKRIDNRAKAAFEFRPILAACLKAFKLRKKDLSSELTNDLRDLRSAACQIGHYKFKIKPTIIMAETLGLTTPAMVYHSANRGVDLYGKSLTYKQKVDEIVKLIRENK